MPKYIFAYHGGSMPETPEEGAAQMEKWGAWFGQMGDAVLDGGAPVGQSKTVSAASVSENGGANPLSGWSVVEADDFDAAVAMAKGCPILDHGTVEVAEAIDM
ncbi:MAG: hypothetical protein AAF360_10670 [Pseudomonadota bacterium]